MNLRGEPLNWEVNTKEHYIPISYKGEVIGFLRPQFATRIANILNEDEILRKALRAACQDILVHTNANPNQLKDLMREYLLNAKRPKSGTGAIIDLLKQRQRELDLSDAEFRKFCDSYKLAPYELQELLSGVDIKNDWLFPLSRILGKSIEELQVIIQNP